MIPWWSLSHQHPSEDVAPLSRMAGGSRAWVVKKYIGYMALLSLVSSGGEKGEEQLPSLYITPFQGSDYPFSFVPQRFFLSIVRSSNQWFQVGWFLSSNIHIPNLQACCILLPSTVWVCLATSCVLLPFSMFQVKVVIAFAINFVSDTEHGENRKWPQLDRIDGMSQVWGRFCYVSKPCPFNWGLLIWFQEVGLYLVHPMSPSSHDMECTEDIHNFWKQIWNPKLIGWGFLYIIRGLGQ